MHILQLYKSNGYCPDRQEINSSVLQLLEVTTADDEVDQRQLQDPESKKGRSLLPKARGTGQVPTRKGGWCALVPLV